MMRDEKDIQKLMLHCVLFAVCVSFQLRMIRTVKKREKYKSLNKVLDRHSSVEKFCVDAK